MAFLLNVKPLLFNYENHKHNIAGRNNGKSQTIAPHANEL